MGIKPQRSLRAQRGFTLLELLMVVAFIGILLGILIPVVGKVRESATIRKVEAQRVALRAAIMTYRNEFHRWPLPDSQADQESYKDATYGGSYPDGNETITFELLNPPGLPPLINMDDYRIDGNELINPTSGTPFEITLDLNYDGGVSNKTMTNLVSIWVE